MALLSGINGQVAVGDSTINGIGKWSVDPKVDLNEFASSATAEAKDRILGNADWTGEYTAYGPEPFVLPGNDFIFTGSIDGLVGVTGTAIMDEFSMRLDVEGGKEIMHSCKFSGNDSNGLAYVSAAVTDDVPQIVTSAVGLKCELGTVAESPTWTEVLDIRTMDITIKRENRDYVSSSTGGNRKRVKGNLNVTFSISCYINDTLAAFTGIFPLGGVRGLRMYVNATEFWQIMWARFGNYSGIECDRNSVNVVGATINGGLSTAALYSGDTVPTLGSVKTPALTVVWPTPVTPPEEPDPEA